MGISDAFDKTKRAIHLLSKNDIPYETIEKDVSECVEKLIIAGLVREDA